jgi:hypothetical protein
MKRFMMLFLVIMVSLSMVVSAADYSDVKEAMAKSREVLSNFVVACDAVKDAAGAAKALNDLATSMEKMIPISTALAKKYKNYMELTQKNPPEELKEESKKMEEVAQKMMGAMMKLGPYMQAPEVKKAQQAMMAMGQKMKKAMEEATGETKKEEQK